MEQWVRAELAEAVLRAAAIDQAEDRTVELAQRQLRGRGVDVRAALGGCWGRPLGERSNPANRGGTRTPL